MALAKLVTLTPAQRASQCSTTLETGHESAATADAKAASMIVGARHRPVFGFAEPNFISKISSLSHGATSLTPPCPIARTAHAPSGPPCCRHAHQVYEGGEDGGGKRVYVGNIAYDLPERLLRCAYCPHRPAAPRARAHPPSVWQYGPLTNISFKQGFAFLDFADERDAQAPIPPSARTPHLFATDR